MKLLTFTIPDALAGAPMQQAVRRMLPQVSQNALREAFERRDVKQNGIRMRKDEPAIGGAEMKVYLSDERTIRSPEILFEDENILVINKPAGISCEVDEQGGLTVGPWLQEALVLSEAPVPCHRLDNPTDGLLLLAKNPIALQTMEDAFAQRLIHKKYVCLVKGQLMPPQATLKAYLFKDAKAARVTIADRPMPGALTIETEYRTLAGGEVSRLEITLHTGRTHQIRAQMAHIGHPVLGDDKYGDRAFNRAMHAGRLMLTATELRFELQGEFAYLNTHLFQATPKF